MSIVWTLRKYIDGAKHREEEAAHRRARKIPLRQGLGQRGDDEPAVAPEQAVALYECRVCQLRSVDGAYCPECLAETMVALPAASATTGNED